MFAPCSCSLSVRRIAVHAIQRPRAKCGALIATLLAYGIGCGTLLRKMTESSPTKTSKLAITALVFSIIGACLFPFALVGLVLGITAFMSIKKSDPPVGGKGLALAAIVIAPAALVTTGILAAIAIPAFMGYIRRAKTQEARAELSSISRGVMSYAQEEVLTSNGAVPKGLPVSIPLTPAHVPCGKQAWPADADPGWNALSFAPSGPIAYSYSVTADPEHHRVILKAKGDLDCDGTYSNFEMTVNVDPATGAITRSDITVENELE